MDEQGNVHADRAELLRALAATIPIGLLLWLLVAMGLSALYGRPIL